MDIEYIEILGNTDPSLLSDQTYEQNSTSCALLWLDRASSAASLIGGQAQVSLAEDYQGETEGQRDSAGLINGGKEVGANRSWFPTTVVAIPDLCSARQTTGGTVRSQQAVPHARTAHPIQVSADSSAASEIDVPELYPVYVSPCLAETLGVAASQRAAKGVRPNGLKLLVRALPSHLVLPAAIVDLRGPYLTTPTSTSTAKFCGKGQPSPSASLVGAVESILSGALEGEILSRGSVVGVAGLFRLVVTNLSTCQEEEHKHERFPSRKGGICESEGLVARVHGATKLRLSPPTQSGRLGVGVGKLLAMSSDPDMSVLAYQSTHCKTTLRVDRNANGTSLKPAGGELCADGTGFARMPSQNPDSTLPSSDPSLSPSVPAYLGTSVANWIRSIEQDVGGRSDQVAAVVAAVAASLKRSKGTAMTSPSSGLLLHGPTGAGKTLLARSVAEHSGAPWFFLDCASVFRRDRGKAERELQDFLLKAMVQSPSIVILDQVEFISRRRPDSAGITELQVYSVLLEMMDRARQATYRSSVFFLATCPSSTALDPSLLQRGRLELVVRLGALDSAARAYVLAIHARGMQLHVKRKGDASVQTTLGACRFEDGQYAALAENGDRQSSPRLHAVSVTDDDDDDPAAGMKEVEGMMETPRALSPTTPQTRDEFLRFVAARCHGCLGSDLERLCREAAMRHMTAVAAAESSRSSDPSRCQGIQANDLSANGNSSKRNGGDVTLDDFLAALDVVRPASLVGSSVGSFWGGGSGSEVSWNAPLVGCDAAMAELRTFILAPLTNSSLLRSLGLRPASGALLHGPPGCGKTSIARALATENKNLANFLEVRCSDLVDKVVGRSERAVSDLFAAARAAAPCVLFLDQVESVAARRGYHSSTEQTFDRILSTLLVEMDGVMTESGGHVVVIAATNDITRLDPSVLRPGRLDRRVYIGPPDLTARQSIFRQRLAAMPLRYRVDGDSPAYLREPARTNENGCSHDNWKVEMPSVRQEAANLDSIEGYVEWLAGETDGASCAQITALCREASMVALREGIGATEVAPRHFKAAIGVQLQRKGLVFSEGFLRERHG